MAQYGMKGEPAASVALARGCTVVDAAKQAGLGERTLWRRVSDPSYMRDISRLRGEMLHQATGRLANSAGAAADVLMTLAESADSEHVRLASARAILELCARLREQSEFEARLSELEDFADDEAP